MEATEVAEAVLRCCRERDPGAVVSSLLRDADGRTVVRVRSDAQRGDALTLLRSMRALWPLAATTARENALDGTMEAEVVVPTAAAELAAARRRAAASRTAAFAWAACVGLFVAGCCVLARDAYRAGYDAVSATAAVAHDEP